MAPFVESAEAPLSPPEDLDLGGLEVVVAAHLTHESERRPWPQRGRTVCEVPRRCSPPRSTAIPQEPSAGWRRGWRVGSSNNLAWRLDWLDRSINPLDGLEIGRATIGHGAATHAITVEESEPGCVLLAVPIAQSQELSWPPSASSCRACGEARRAWWQPFRSPPGVSESGRQCFDGRRPGNCRSAPLAFPF